MDASRRWVLKALHEVADQLTGELWGLPEAAAPSVEGRPSEGGWGPHEIVAHLRDAEARFSEQLRRLTSERDPPLPAEPLELLPEDRDYASVPLPQLLWELMELRERSCSLLAGLNPSAWDRAGHHPYRGRRSIAQIAREMVEHDLEHLWQVRRLKEPLAAGGAPARGHGSGP